MATRAKRTRARTTLWRSYSFFTARRFHKACERVHTHTHTHTHTFDPPENRSIASPSSPAVEAAAAAATRSPWTTDVKMRNSEHACLECLMLSLSSCARVNQRAAGTHLRERKERAVLLMNPIIRAWRTSSVGRIHADKTNSSILRASEKAFLPYSSRLGLRLVGVQSFGRMRTCPCEGLSQIFRIQEKPTVEQATRHRCPVQRVGSKVRSALP